MYGVYGKSSLGKTMYAKPMSVCNESALRPIDLKRLASDSAWFLPILDRESPKKRFSVQPDSAVFNSSDSTLDQFASICSKVGKRTVPSPLQISFKKAPFPTQEARESVVAIQRSGLDILNQIISYFPISEDIKSLLHHNSMLLFELGFDQVSLRDLVGLSDRDSLVDKLAWMSMHKKLFMSVRGLDIGIFFKTKRGYKQKTNNLQKLVALGVECPALNSLLDSPNSTIKITHLKLLRGFSIDFPIIFDILSRPDFEQRVIFVKALKSMGISSNSLNSILKNDDLGARIASAEVFFRMGLDVVSVGLVLEEGDVVLKTLLSQKMKGMGFSGDTIGQVLHSGDVCKKVDQAEMLLQMGVLEECIGSILNSDEFEKKVAIAQMLYDANMLDGENMGLFLQRKDLETFLSQQNF